MTEAFGVVRPVGVLRIVGDLASAARWSVAVRVYNSDCNVDERRTSSAVRDPS